MRFLLIFFCALAFGQRTGKDSISVKTSVLRLRPFTTNQIQNSLPRTSIDIDRGIVWNSDTKTLWGYDGTQWKDLGLAPAEGSITIDSEISLTSLNTVENQAVGKRFIKTVDEAGAQMKMWIGDQFQYALSQKDSSTMYLVLDSIYDPSPSGEGQDGLIKDVVLDDQTLDFISQGDAFGGEIDLSQLDVDGQITQVNQSVTTYRIDPANNWELQIERDALEEIPMSRLIQDASEISLNNTTDEYYLNFDIESEIKKAFRSAYGKNAVNFIYSSSYPNYRVYNNLSGAINSSWRLNPSFYGTNLSFPYSFGDIAFEQDLDDLDDFPWYDGDSPDLLGGGSGGSIIRSAGPGVRFYGSASPYGNTTVAQSPTIDPDIEFKDQNKGKFSEYVSGNMLYFFLETDIGYGSGLFYADAQPNNNGGDLDDPHYFMNVYDQEDLSPGDFVSLFGEVFAQNDYTNVQGSQPDLPFYSGDVVGAVRTPENIQRLAMPALGLTKKINLNIVTDPPASELAEKGYFISARAEYVTNNQTDYTQLGGINPSSGERMRRIFAQDQEGITWRINIGALPIKHGGSDTDLFTVNQGVIPDNPIKVYISGALPLQ